MEHGEPKNKSQRDRLRQVRGAQRKEDIKAIRRIVQSWKGGRDAAACMTAIADTLDKRGSTA
jgi:hypothetical protein